MRASRPSTSRRGSTQTTASAASYPDPRYDHNYIGPYVPPSTYRFAEHGSVPSNMAPTGYFPPHPPYTPAVHLVPQTNPPSSYFPPAHSYPQSAVSPTSEQAYYPPFASSTPGLVSNATSSSSAPKLSMKRAAKTIASGLRFSRSSLKSQSQSQNQLPAPAPPSLAIPTYTYTQEQLRNAIPIHSPTHPWFPYYYPDHAKAMGIPVPTFLDGTPTTTPTTTASSNPNTSNPAVTSHIVVVPAPKKKAKTSSRTKTVGDKIGETAVENPPAMASSTAASKDPDAPPSANLDLSTRPKSELVPPPISVQPSPTQIALPLSPPTDSDPPLLPDLVSRLESLAQEDSSRTDEQITPSAVPLPLSPALLSSQIPPAPPIASILVPESIGPNTDASGYVPPPQAQPVIMLEDGRTIPDLPLWMRTDMEEKKKREQATGAVPTMATLAVPPMMDPYANWRTRTQAGNPGADVSDLKEKRRDETSEERKARKEARRAAREARVKAALLAAANGAQGPRPSELDAAKHTAPEQVNAQSAAAIEESHRQKQQVHPETADTKSRRTRSHSVTQTTAAAIPTTEVGPRAYFSNLTGAATSPTSPSFAYPYWNPYSYANAYPYGPISPSQAGVPPPAPIPIPSPVGAPPTRPSLMQMESSASAATVTSKLTTKSGFSSLLRKKRKDKPTMEAPAPLDLSTATFNPSLSSKKDPEKMSRRPSAAPSLTPSGMTTSTATLSTPTSSIPPSSYSTKPSYNSQHSSQRSRRSQSSQSQPPTLHSPTHQKIIMFDDPSGSYGFLSPRSNHKIYFGKRLYPSAEHLFHAWKFLPAKSTSSGGGMGMFGIGGGGNGGGAAKAEMVRMSEDPRVEAEKMKEWWRKDWEEVKIDAMVQVMYMKFTQHEEILRQLVGLYPAHLVWTSREDAVFGMGPSGSGSNELGYLLVKLRDRLKVEGGL